jgi:adenylate kinase family enzyme
MEGSERRGLSRRIAVVGTSGSGKTTLAHRLAQQLGIPHVELDALYWDPNWTPAPPDLFRERAAEALSGQTWTADGNYSTVRDIVWKRADTVVWLDYSLPVIMGRVTWRTERLQEALLSRDSIVWWALRTYHRRKKEFPNLFSLPEYAHLNVVHLRSPQAAREWLSTQGAMPGERQPVPD